MLNVNAQGAHKGAVIHHQDQFITPVSLSIKNTTNVSINTIPAEVSYEYIFRISYNFLITIKYMD